MSVTIRPERDGDGPAIAEVTRAAFARLDRGSGTEADIVDTLRADGDLSLSLVAVDAEGAVVGHIAFSRVSVGDEDGVWFGLGPVSVTPVWQRYGIGTALIVRGLADIRRQDARGVVLVGDPAYYARFGFEPSPRLTYREEPSAYLQVLVFSGEGPEGNVVYAPAFSPRPAG